MGAVRFKADAVKIAGDEITFRITREGLYSIRAAFDEIKEKALAVELKEWRERRTLQANAYAWTLIDRIAEVQGLSRTEVYRQYIRDIPSNSEVYQIPSAAADVLVNGWTKNGLGWLADVEPCGTGYVVVTLYCGSSTYDTRQMSILIDLIVQDAKELGIETLTPMELERMKEDWREKQPSKSL